MIRKIIIVALVIIVGALAMSYHTALINERGENLIADAYYGKLESVKDDVENGAPPDFTLYFTDEEREYHGVTFNALQAAASGGNEDVINYLLDLGLDINAQTANGWTPLFIAARDGQAEAAKLLVFRQADLNIQTDLGATALLMAVTQKYSSEQERTDLLAYLLKRGADPNLAVEGDLTPLYYAAVLQNQQAVELLLEHHARLTVPVYEKAALYLKKSNTPTAKKITALLKKKAVQKP